LSHESQFVQAIPVDAVAEEDLLTQVDEYFQRETEHPMLADAGVQAEQSEQLLEN
jgi:hypothetical protein